MTYEEAKEDLVEIVKKLPGIHSVSADLGGDLIRVDIERGMLLWMLVILASVCYTKKEPPTIYPVVHPEDANYCNCCCEYPWKNDYVRVHTELEE